MERVFHRVQVVKVAEEFIESVEGWEKFILVPEVVFAELARGVALRFEGSGNGAGFGGHPDGCARLANRGQAGADGQLPGDEVRAARRAARLSIIVRELHALLGQFVKVRGSAGHHAHVIGTDVGPADVVGHDDDNVGFLVRRVNGDIVAVKRRARRQQ